jgi:hypothetical protein
MDQKMTIENPLSNLQPDQLQHHLVNSRFVCSNKSSPKYGEGRTIPSSC